MNKKILMVMLAICLLASCKKSADVEAANKDAETETDTNKELQLKESTPAEIGEAYGVILAKTVQATGIKLDIEALKKSYNKAIKKDVPPEDEQMAGLVIGNAMNLAAQKRKAENKKKGEEFLAENAKRDGVATLDNGIQIETLTEGTGISPMENWVCTLHYKGMFIDGKEFDNSYDVGDGKPIDITLDHVIEGWKKGLPHMKVGGKYKLYLPYEMAYGEAGIVAQNGQELIPPCAALVFEIELLGTKPAGMPPKTPIE